MATMTQHAAGMFCWCQLGTSDPEAARKFYPGLFGWAFENTTISGQPMTLIQKGGKDVGALYGLMGQQRERGVPPHWESYVAVDNADQTAALVRRHGGKVLVEPMDVLDHGRMAVCEDPTGATFSLWQAGRQIGAGVVNEPGSMTWNELITDDAARAGAFYGQVFGWSEDRVPMANGTYTVFKKSDAQAAGMMQATPDMRLTHPYWLVYFAVEDCDAIATKAKQLGGQIRKAPADIPHIGRFAVLTDPQDAWFAIIAMARRV
jgi:predicted enzyme related to lactoylglutathione lyase